MITNLPQNLLALDDPKPMTTPMTTTAHLMAEPAEAEAFLAANPEIAFIEVIFTALSGVPRGKRVRRSELATIYATGRLFPSTMLVADVTGQDCEDTGLVWGTGDPDYLLRPVPGTLVKAPWLGDDVAQVLTSMYYLDGTPCELDPRHVLRGVVSRFAELGLTPVVACEIEYYLVDAQRGPRGEVRLAGAPATGVVPHNIDVFSLRDVQDFAPFFKELWRQADVQGIPLEAVIAEYAAGQVELTLHHRPDALRAGDEAQMYKRLAKGVAVSQGMEATFMAKPFSQSAGSSMHLHFSMADASGANIFTSEDPEGTPTMRHAIGGLRETQSQAFGIFAPNANSYRRFRANSYAPHRADLGGEQPLGLLARPRRSTRLAPCRAPLCRRGRQPLPRARRDVGRRAPRHGQSDRSRPSRGRRWLQGSGGQPLSGARKLVRRDRRAGKFRDHARLSGLALRRHVLRGEAHRTGPLLQRGHRARL